MQVYNVNNGTAWRWGFWLVFDGGGTSQPRVASRSPSLRRHERAIYLEVTLPKSLWEIPTLKASIVVDSPEASASVIDVAAVSEAVRKATGLDFDIQVVEQPAITGETDDQN